MRDSWSRPIITSAGWSIALRPRRPRRHADLLHHRRQRRLGRRNDQRLLQRDDDVERHAGHRDAGVPASKIDDFGTPKAYNHYAVGWAHALCAPYQWTKQVASHWGGTRNGTIVHWPNGRESQRRDSQPVPPRHRRGEDDPGRRRPARANVRQRHRAGAARRGQHGATPSTTRRPRRPTSSSTSRCSAIAASTIRVGRR